MSISEGKAKNRGMIFHLAHLPATGSAIGQFNDPETDEFIDFMVNSKQTHWIIQPLTPIGDDLSPYNTSSRFDRNKYFINLNQLATKEYGNLLNKADLPDDLPTTGFSILILRAQKDHRFETAYKNFKKLQDSSNLLKEFKLFCSQEGSLWLDNNSIYEGLIPEYGYDWRYWPDEFKFLPEKTEDKTFEEKVNYLIKYNIKNENIEKINQFRFEQFIFKKQFNEFKEKLDSHNIKLFVDLAYAISPNGKDVWSHKSIVELDDNFYPIRLTGCPPEMVDPTTQRWGQAVWNYQGKDYWKYQEDSIRFLLKEGCIRLDHFGGLVNRAAIPNKVSKDGRTLYGDSIFKPVEEGGFGPGYWEKHWLEDVSNFRNNKGENLIDMYLRVAKEEGFSPEDTFIVEDLGSVCATETFNAFMREYGTRLAGLRLPITYGIDVSIDAPKIIDHHNNDSNPYNIKGGIENVALLSGSHDPPALIEIIATLLESPDKDFGGGYVNSPMHFRAFCRQQLNINDDQFWDYRKINLECLKWIYRQPARHAQTTVSDALGIYFRPNMPGGWNGSEDKWYMKNTIDGLFNYWGRQFPKGFLTRDDKGGMYPGYKQNADQYISLMQELYPSEVLV
ncbi:MAG: 4-alpha-glucanotransferase [Bacillota bacterium]